MSKGVRRDPGRRAVALIAAALAVGGALVPPGASARQPVGRAPTLLLRLGAGEHDGFSRIALNNAPASGWTAESRPRGLTLRLPGVGWRIDDAAVSRKRRAHRVSGVSVRKERGQTALSFAFNCDCEAKPRVTASGLLMFDVRPRPGAAAPQERWAAVAAGDIATATTPAAAEKQDAAQPEAPAKTPETAPLDVEGARAYLLKQLERAAAEGLIKFQDEASAEAAAAELSAAEAASGATPVSDDAPAASPADHGAPVDRAAAPARVARDHAPGVAAPEAPAVKGPAPEYHAPENHGAGGDGAGGHAPKAPAPKRATQDRPAEAARGADHDPAGRRAAPARQARAGDGVAMEPAADHGAEDPGAAPEPAPAPVAAEPCPADELLNARNWLSEEPYFDALAARRAALFDGLNNVDPRALADLQRLYLGRFFGAEAAAAPRAFRSEDPEVLLLAAVGEVLADRAPAADSPLNRRTPCPGRQALWQAAALAETEPLRALRAYRLGARVLLTMPSQYRRPLGGRIALAAAKEGEIEIASEVMSLLERSQLPPTADMRLTRATLALTVGRVVAAQRELEEVLKEDGPDAVQAALLMAEALREPNEAPRALLLADELADLSLIHRGRPEMLALVKAEADVRSRFGQMPQALIAIEIAQRYGDSDVAALEAMRVALLDEIVATAGVPREGEAGAETVSGPASERALERLAESVAVVSGLAPGEENDRIRGDLAERLIDLGSPHLVPLLIDDALAARSERAATLREKAADAARLVDPLGGAHGALSMGAGAAKPPPPGPGGGVLTDADVAAYFAQDPEEAAKAEEPAAQEQDHADLDHAGQDPVGQDQVGQDPVGQDHPAAGPDHAAPPTGGGVAYETADAPAGAQAPGAPHEGAGAHDGAEPDAAGPDIPIPVISAPPAASALEEGQALVRGVDEDLARIRAIASGLSSSDADPASETLAPGSPASTAQDGLGSNPEGGKPR